MDYDKYMDSEIIPSFLNQETDEDYYYVVGDMNGIHRLSCVCGLIELKGKIDDQDYERLERLFKLNIDPTINTQRVS